MRSMIEDKSSEQSKGRHMKVFAIPGDVTFDDTQSSSCN